MEFLPITRMRERLEVDRADSDVSFCMTLLYFGEMALKLITAGVVGAIVDDRERHRYRQLHRLVRANGLGD